MKYSFKIVLPLLAIVAGLSSCLKEGDANFSEDNLTNSILELQFIEGGSGTTINSGLQYFGGAALTYPASHTADTAHINVSLAGAKTMDKDLNVTIGVDETKRLDYYGSDSIQYEIMPDSLYDFVGTSATIKAGERVAPLEVVFYPSKIDPTKSYILPVTVTEPSGVTVSSNFGTVYFHVIGNPIAGNYLRTYYRWNLNSAPALGNIPTESLAGYEEKVYTFTPINPSTVAVPTGYYYQIDYNITFDNNNGVLSNFNVAFDKGQYDTYFVANGVTLVEGPKIMDMSPDQTYFEIHYVVTNGSAYRYIIDVYEKQ